MTFANSKQRNIYGLILAGLLTIIFLMPSVAEAQAPVITCQGAIELTLDDIGTVCIELPITGADNVDAGTGTWNNNDTLCISVTMPVTQTFRVIASNVSGADTCDVTVSFPGVTTKSGTISGETWTKESSPYIIVGDIFIAQLTIEPGVTVWFHGSFVFEVAGVLTAVGTELEPITLTAAPYVSSWKGVLFRNSVAGSELSWCLINRVDGNGIRIYDSFPSLRHCTISNCSVRGLYISLNIPGDLTVSNCITSGNGPTTYNGVGISVTANSGKVTFENCSITNNNATREGTIRGAGAWVSGNVEFKHCLFQGNYVYGNDYTPGGNSRGEGGGIYVSSGQVLIANCSIYANTARGRAQGGMSGNAGYAYGAGAYINSGQVTFINTVIADNVSTSTHGTHGGGIYANSGQVDFKNCTLVRNNDLVLEINTANVNVINSIIYFNTGGTTPITSSAIITYSDVQGGFPGDSNININPILGPDDKIGMFSLCIDAGDPALAYNDLCFPPSLGTDRNDIGAHGGPGACGWEGKLAPARILCPGDKVYTVCELGSDVCITLPISNADDVYTSAGNWSNDLLCFTPTDTGTYSFGIIAENSTSADTCQFTVTVNQVVPLTLNTSQIIFAITESQTNMPTPKYLQVSSPCANGISNWNAEVFSDGGWLQLDKNSGTNPDSIMLSVDSAGYSAGIYSAVVVLTDAASGDILASTNVTLFVAPGTDVGTVATKPGNVVAIPISINTDNNNPNDSVKGFTIPLKYHSMQLDKIRADSVVFDGLLFDNMNLIFDPINGVIIVDRPTQDPPLPDSTYLAKIFFTIDTSAADELVLIDTTIYSDGINTYEYQFVQSTGDTTIPSFSPGAIVIGYYPEPIKITAPSGTYLLDSIPMFKCVPLVIENAAIVIIEGTNPQGNTLAGVTWENGTLCFTATESGAYTFTVRADNGYYNVQVTFGFDTQSGIAGRDQGVLPQIYEMRQNYPNPFNPTTNIDFSLPKASQVTLEVYNITGRKVITLIDQKLGAGFYTVDWDSRSKTGKPIASGVYFYRLKAGDFLETKKMLLLK